MATKQPTIGAALQYAEDKLGGPIVESDSMPTIAITVTTIVLGSGERVALVMINTGANPVYVAPNPAVSPTNGIALAANGGSITMDVTTDFTLMSRQWYGIATGGSTTLYVLELNRYAYSNPDMP